VICELACVFLLVKRGKLLVFCGEFVVFCVVVFAVYFFHHFERYFYSPRGNHGGVLPVSAEWALRR